ncbi:MAG: hypothetical protein K6A41_09445 [Bacteroidales bacterium]|nr:hypothetical protein [Bacteroidales bacterium]
MIYFELNDLNKENIYRKTQSMIEYLCDKYSFGEQMGVIEMANHTLIDQLIEKHPDFSLDVNAHLENNTLVFNYQSTDSIFQFVDEMSTSLEESNIWTILTEESTLSPDYKSFTFEFYVKPHQNIARVSTNSVLQTKDSYLQ